MPRSPTSARNLWHTQRCAWIQVDADGLELMSRSSRLAFIESPLPASVQKLWGRSDIAFTVRACFHKHVYDRAHPYTYSTEFPVMSDRISVEGAQWCEPISPHRCRLCARVSVSVRIVGVGGQIEKSIERGMRDAYATVAPRQRDYMQLQREQGVREYTPPPSPLPDGAALASTTCDAASLVGSSGRADGEAAGKPPPPLSLRGQTERVCELRGCLCHCVGACVPVRVPVLCCVYARVCVQPL